MKPGDGFEMPNRCINLKDSFEYSGHHWLNFKNKMNNDGNVVCTLSSHYSPGDKKRSRVEVIKVMI